MESPRLGLVVNPIAGMGGRVGVHGTDGPALRAALDRGAVPGAPLRAQRALLRLHELIPQLTVHTVTGAMGTDHLPPDHHWHVVATDGPLGPSTAADTRTAVASMVSAGVHLVLFVGGDGTARDVLASAGERTPVLGVPAGVKMHSAVFATTPALAGATAARYLLDAGGLGTRAAEVVDLDESGVRLFGIAHVPAVRDSVQRAKATVGTSTDASLHALGREVATEMQPGVLYLLGPGTTVGHVNDALAVPTSPLGVDVVLDGRLLLPDASEQQLLDLLATHQHARIVLGVVGGQGFLLGRGNQQLSPAVLDAVGTDNVDVLAAPSKIAALESPVLHIDLDDEPVSTRLSGYRQVRTAPRRSVVLRVVASAVA
jgi:predicted polyphosphate/ATP-dependent NAD kinase